MKRRKNTASHSNRAHHCLTTLTKALANPFLPVLANDVCNPMAPTSTFDQTRYTHFQINSSFALWTIPNLASDIAQVFFLDRGATFTDHVDGTEYSGYPDFESVYLVNGITTYFGAG